MAPDPTAAARSQALLESSAPASAALAVHGPLAAAMDRLAMLAASALRSPFAFIILTGDDRRCFAAGSSLPDWALHDAGAMWRSGFVELISDGPVRMGDLTRDLTAEQLTACQELELGSIIGVPIRSSAGQVLGVFCAADQQPSPWNEEDLQMLQRFASTAASDWELRRTLAEHEANERRLGAFHNMDPLTGLANRGVFLDRLRVALHRPRARISAAIAAAVDDETANEPPQDELVAVFFLDVNDFRKLNERFGHQVGDQVLASVGKRLQQAAGPEAVVSRLGGDEFAVLVERLDADAAEEMAEHFRSVLSTPTSIGGIDMSIGVSVGVAMSTTSAELPEHVLRGADLAMARAKRATRPNEAARPVVFDWKIAAEARARRRLEDELRQAVVEEQFALHYLPIVSLEDERISGAEALIRWQHPTRGLLAPFEFLAVAEEMGLIYDIGRWVLRESCNQLREWNVGPASDAPMTIAVNLSTRQFSATSFLNDITRTFKVFGLPPASVTLEVNERVVAKDVEQAAGVLTALRSLGARIFLDDFGSGNSPISYLQRLPLDGVKIDHTQVSKMDRDEKSLRLVRSVVVLAREFGLEVVAEGITTAAHLKMLKEIGCTHGQGHMFSRAVDAGALTRMIAERPW
jgi:diguanylate cyclase (GGDEF)-like protein